MELRKKSKKSKKVKNVFLSMKVDVLKLDF